MIAIYNIAFFAIVKVAKLISIFRLLFITLFLLLTFIKIIEVYRLYIVISLVSI